MNFLSLITPTQYSASLTLTKKHVNNKKNGTSYKYNVPMIVKCKPLRLHFFSTCSREQPRALPRVKSPRQYDKQAIASQFR